MSDITVTMFWIVGRGTMIKLNLQLFGGRGAGGPSLTKGGGKSINIQSETDVWSYRHNPNNEPFVDAINSGVREISDDFPGLMDDVREVNSAKLGGKDKTETLGFYGNGRVALNENYTDIGKMNRVYDEAVKSGYHPSRGNKTGTEAVALHEMGHALTDHVAKKMGAKDIDDGAKKIVDSAYKATGGKGSAKKSWAGKISGYATENYAECVAEAVADCYCNGKKASKNSQAIMAELKKYK